MHLNTTRQAASTHAPLQRCWKTAVALLLVALAGCAAPLDARKDSEFQTYAHAADRPSVRPVRSLSSFSDSMMCMDRLFRDAELPTTLITSKQIPDFSNRVPVATKDMVITALSQMSRLSNAFRYVDYEVDISRQDTVQNLTTILLNNNQMQLQRPALYISGAVAFVDQNVMNNRFDVGTSAARLESGFSRNRNATIIGLELHLGDFRTRTIIPGLDSANEVVVSNSGQGLDLAGRIGEYGWQFNVGRDYAQGAGAAIRTLVELATIELTGKWARVPYWQCLTMEQTHPEFQRQLRDWYDEGEPAIHQGLVRRSLISAGYLGPQADKLSVNSLEFRLALARFQADNGMVVNGTVDFATYERALRGFVILGDDGKLTRVGWRGTSSEPLAANETDQGPQTVASSPSQRGLGAPAEALKLNMQIENVVPDRSVFEAGDQIFLSATVSRAAYLYCYMAEAQGNLVRLLPNATHPQAMVSAAQAIRIPDWMSPNPGFMLDAGVPGTEGVMCLASAQDPLLKLPAALQAPALTVIGQYKGLASVREAFVAALGESGVVEQSVQWRVVPRQARSRQP
jgi:hypothetical protein